MYAYLLALVQSAESRPPTYVRMHISKVVNCLSCAATYVCTYVCTYLVKIRTYSTLNLKLFTSSIFITGCQCF